MVRSSKLLPLAFLVFGLLSGIAGFLVGRQFVSHGADVRSEPEQSRINTKANPNRVIASTKIEDLEQILADHTSLSSRSQKFSGTIEQRLLAGQNSELLRDLKALPGSPDRNAALLRLAGSPPSTMTMREWSEMMLAGLEGVERSSVSSALAQSWAEKDARGAFGHAIKEVDAGYRADLLDESIVRLARDHASQTANLLLGSRTDLGGGFAQALSRLCEVWSETQPQAAKQWVAEHSTNWMPYERDEANAMILTTMALEHPWGAVKELSIISDSDRRNLTIREIFTRWAAVDPAGAALALPKHRPGNDAELATEVALTWSDYDYPSTVNWVKITPAIPDELRAEVLKRVDEAHGGTSTRDDAPE